MISVIIPAYNRIKFLDEAIQSVLSQTYTDFKILVIDDFSQEPVEELVNSYQDERIEYFLNERKKGAQGARNTGILKSSRKYLAFLDSDDKWEADKLKMQVEFMESNNYDFSFVNYVRFGTKEKYNKVNITNIYRENYAGSFSGVMLSKHLQEKVGLLNESLPSCQDWEYWIRCSEETKLHYLDKYLLRYREGNYQKITNNTNTVMEGYKYIYRTYILNCDDEIKGFHFYLWSKVINEIPKKIKFLIISIKLEFTFKKVIVFFYLLMTYFFYDKK